MGIQKKEIDYAKEIGDVMIAVNNLAASIRQKKPLAEIMATELPLVVSAIDNCQDIPNEAKANRKVFIQTIGYHTGEMVDALIG